MREFKFRAWCVLGGKGSFIYFDIDNRNSLDFDIFDEIPIVQQFTSLKDKNGKAIYEGDILKLNDKGKNYPSGEVYFNSGAFFVRGIDGLWFGAKHGICEDYEIIGNIFEK